jgi:hypothetical protein
MNDQPEWFYEGHGIWRETTSKVVPYPWIMKASEDPSGAYILFYGDNLRTRHHSFEQAAKAYQIGHCPCC